MIRSLISKTAVWFGCVPAVHKIEMNEWMPDEYRKFNFVYFPYFTIHRDNSTKELFWSHPKGHPYKVYDGPLHPYPRNAPIEQQRQLWTDTLYLPGYKVVECYYTDALFLVWDRENERG